MRVVVAALLCTLPLRAQTASSPAETFADEVVRAGWSGNAMANGVSATVRRIRLFSKGMVQATRGSEALTEEQRAALEDVMRVTFTEAGWYLDAAVEPGTYRIGIEASGSDFQFVMRDPDGSRIADSAYWVGSTSNELAAVGVTSGQGFMKTNLRVGDSTISWRFVSQSALRSAVGDVTTVEAGPIRILTDIKALDGVRALAEECRKAIRVHARVLQASPPKGPYEIYLLHTKGRFEKVGNLLNDGQFNDRRGFHLGLTGHGFVDCYHVWHAGCDKRLPLQLRSTTIHELHHMVADRAYPSMSSRWPVWLKEGLAEAGTLKALGKKDREHERARIDAYWLESQRRGTAPRPEDLFGDSTGDPVDAFYAAALYLVEEMLRRPKKVKALLRLLTDHLHEPTSRVLARAWFEREYGPAVEVLRKVTNRKASNVPLLRNGFIEIEKETWSVLTGRNRAAFAILPPVKEEAPDQTLRTAFQWDTAGQSQADLYLAYARGQRAEQFLKIAVGPRYIMLFWNRYGSWTTVGRVNYDKDLPLGGWHDVEATTDGDSVSVTVGPRTETFELPYTVPLRGTRAGVGAYGSLVRFRNPQVK
ncbi:MAG: hypothetical protein AAGD14_04820 [Planctomycetota bacterium]